MNRLPTITDFKKRAIKVLGVSLDNETSHQEFAKKYKPPLSLLADTDRSISEAYGTYGQKKFMGAPTWACIMTFPIDEKGKIKKIFGKVKPEEHASEVLKAFSG